MFSILDGQVKLQSSKVLLFSCCFKHTRGVSSRIGSRNFHCYLPDCCTSAFDIVGRMERTHNCRTTCLNYSRLIFHFGQVIESTTTFSPYPQEQYAVRDRVRVGVKDRVLTMILFIVKRTSCEKTKTYKIANDNTPRQYLSSQHKSRQRRLLRSSGSHHMFSLRHALAFTDTLVSQRSPTSASAQMTEVSHMALSDSNRDLSTYFTITDDKF